jgi:molecular chaperone GrpE (heat shock protein)
LKTKELENLKLQSQHLREKETKLEEEFEMMTKSSCEPIRLTDEDIDKIEQEIQQEIEEIYLQLDAEFEEKKNRLQHTRDQVICLERLYHHVLIIFIHLLLISIRWQKGRWIWCMQI